ncbi:RNase H-like domain found in reverse transcriptase [Popillia japonica]|uniref:RNase H-like domain found in reverse transcriptase n=1 Tax=Popillia japonica TaxID=7064 RepID=A0AAW1LET6_POPJA
MNTGNRAQRGAGRGHAFHAEPDNTTTEDDIGYIMNGIIGTDFLNERSAVINFEKFSCSFWNARHKIVLPLESKHNCYTIIPPRCEIIKYFWVDNEDDCIVLPNEVSEDNIQVSLDRVNKVLDLIDMKTLNKEERDSIQKICAKYSVFLLENDTVTVTNVITESITLKDNARPVYVKPYRLPHAHKLQIDEQIDKMLADGIIEETRSNWSSTLLIVPKKPDSNKLIKLELDPRSRKYTAFTTNKGQFQMTRLPMGLKTSPSSFSRVMTIAMSGLNFESCFVYLDDLIVFGNSLGNHNQNLIKVLDRLRQVNLKLNPVKCEFLKKEILYLGHFIPNFAYIAVPLNKLSRKTVEFNWDENCQEAFEELKQAIINPPILQCPNFAVDNKFILTTDASGYAIGAVLSNSDNKPIAYASRALNKSEIKYPTIDKELLAIDGL